MTIYNEVNGRDSLEALLFDAVSRQVDLSGVPTGGPTCVRLPRRRGE